MSKKVGRDKNNEVLSDQSPEPLSDYEKSLFAVGMDDFFELAFFQVEEGEISIEQLAEFFPEEIRQRNS